jgi:hypothetical protein
MYRVLYIMDLFDFHGSFLYNLPSIVGDNPVVIAANKVCTRFSYLIMCLYTLMVS